MESSLDTRLHSNKVLISSSSVSSEEDEEDEPSSAYKNLEENLARPGPQPGCYEEQLMMMMVELGRTSAVRPGSSEQSHPHFLTLFLSPTTSPSSSCHHLHHPDLQHQPSYPHHHCRNCDRRLSKTCIPNHDDRIRRRFRFLGIPTTTTVNIPNREMDRGMMTSF